MATVPTLAQYKLGTNTQWNFLVGMCWFSNDFFVHRITHGKCQLYLCHKFRKTQRSELEPKR